MDNREALAEKPEAPAVEQEAVEEKEERRFVILSDEEIQKIAKMAAKEGADAYKKELEATLKERTEKVRYSAKTLIQHYRKLKRMKESAVYEPENLTDVTLKEVFENIIGECRRGEFNMTSIKKSTITTGVIMNHVDVQLENYKRECERSQIPDIQRRYRIVEMVYLSEEPMTIEEVAEVECIDKSNVYRTLEKAYDDLTALFFGVEGLDIAEYRRQKRMEKRAERKNRAKKSQ